MPHILFAISPHGFGHAAMVAPLINELHCRHPQWRITLRSTLSSAFLASRITAPYVLDAKADDFGMVQHNALEVDVTASAARYHELHRDWQHHVTRVAEELTTQQPDMVIADVPYLTLAAAQQAGIANMALCCLHWGDIYGHYCQHLAEGPAIHSQIMTAYRQADLFLRTEPAMPMNGLSNIRSIGPLARAGSSRRTELKQKLGLGEEEMVVLVAMGGIGFRLPMERWPHFPKLRFIAQRDWQVRRSDTHVLEELEMPFADLLASCDLLLTKPGYGSFSEAAVNGIPALYVPRDDWPESRWLVAWLEQHGSCAPIARDALEAGEIAAAMEALWSRDATPRYQSSAIDDALHEIEMLLRPR